MRCRYKTSNLYIANYGSDVIVNNIVSTNKYIFEKIVIDGYTRYIDIYNQNTIYNSEGFYYDLPYIENIVPLKSAMPYIGSIITEENICKIIHQINNATYNNMVYIDFDGVIMDTEEELFREWRKNLRRHLLSEDDKIKYIADTNWEYVLNHSEPINDALMYLDKMDANTTAILTKVHSLNNEGSAKIKWCRQNGIKQNIILVPYNVKKSDVVNAKGNILIDDCIKNLDEWEEKEGQGILFDVDDDDMDSWHKPNIKPYSKVLSLKNIIR